MTARNGNGVHITNFGSFGGPLESLADQNGFIADDETGPWDLRYDHAESTHDDDDDGDGELTEYGEWWEAVGFEEHQDRCIAALARVNAAMNAWHREEGWI